MTRRLAAAGLLLGLAVGPALAGCSDDSDPAPAPSESEPGVVAPTPSDPAPTASVSPSPSDTGPTGEPGPGAPSDAPVADFCDAYAALSEQGAAPVGPAAVRETKAAVDRLRRVGTPTGIPADARAGLLVLVGLIRAVPDDATAEELGHVGDALPPADQRSFIALTTYAATTCPTGG